jgi:hypothetical protein
MVAKPLKPWIWQRPEWPEFGIRPAWRNIHPFEDGNGRVGRALLDRALAQDENRSGQSALGPGPID